MSDKEYRIEDFEIFNPIREWEEEIIYGMRSIINEKKLNKNINKERLDQALKLVDSFYEFLRVNYYNDIEELYSGIRNLAQIGASFRDCGMPEVTEKIFSVIEKIFSRIIEINPEDDKILYRRAESFMILGKTEEAIKYFDIFIKINSTRTPEGEEKKLLLSAWNNKGTILLDLGKVEEAIECFDQAIKIDPNYKIPWYNKGIVFFNLEKYQDALKYFEEAIKLDPEFALGWYRKGLVLKELGKNEEADKCFEQAKKINPNIF
jgi:tetratricopeptide (TPR) repeat protein